MTKEIYPIIKVFADNLNTLLIKYTKQIDKGDVGGSLNTLKNMDILLRVIKDIEENKSLGTVLNNLSIVWGSLENNDEISEGFAGKRKMHEFSALVKNN